MEKFWALDYVNDETNECELVYGDQLYATEADAQLARLRADCTNQLEVNWYTILDLEDDVFDCPFTIDDHLHIIY